MLTLIHPTDHATLILLTLVNLIYTVNLGKAIDPYCYNKNTHLYLYAVEG